jgi:hypothetical protein
LAQRQLQGPRFEFADSAAAAKEYVLTAATGINDSCSIVANGYAKKTGATVSVGFLLTPTDSSGCANGF